MDSGMRPRLLDLFCGAGGAAMGYHRAGFDVVGVDINPQPHYPFEFHQADALTYPLDGFDAIHTSPPCQAYANVTRWTGCQSGHPDLVPVMLARLRGQNAPWIVENVPGAPIRPDFILCGSMFGLRVQRHRWFQTSWSAYGLIPTCDHRGLLPFMHKGEHAYTNAMDCGWMSNMEGRQAVPPAYTEFIGEHLLAAVGCAA
jgi:hypothetical protein